MFVKYINILKSDFTDLYNTISNPVTTNTEYFKTLIELLNIFKKEESNYLKCVFNIITGYFFLHFYDVKKYSIYFKIKKLYKIKKNAQNIKIIKTV